LLAHSRPVDVPAALLGQIGCCYSVIRILGAIFPDFNFSNRFRRRSQDNRSARAVFTASANTAGYSAISIPCASSKSGLPIGFQLVGLVGHDDVILATAAHYEALHPKPGSPFPF